ncbi:MAG: 1-(5-phosphoribosyl)-5-[(5-phosphoribosylamino)methylideneamino]imidazole-4-carboxamide isomerase [Bacteroidales bacterium]|nr:1-(5-phosphoribosyl)-5-[(5-phosphoribosylamino)methylideneamino]imidazole-4-carboxamide isomerase [Bacteroidales bacterium]
MRIIVALDIMGGKCVRLSKGDFSTKKVYSSDPLEVARQVEDHGIEYIHLVDLDGARNKRITNLGILEKIATETSLKIDFGGGIRSSHDLQNAFNSGAIQVTCGSISVTDRPLVLEWLREWGEDKIILGADSANRNITTEGWTENSGSDIIDFITWYRERGFKYAICTDIDKDGMLQGPSTDLYREILGIPGLNLIASGGISSVGDLETLSAIGCEGAIVGKALYEGILDLKDIARLC